VSGAFRRRRKSLAHQNRSFKLARELEEGAARPMERLNADIDAWREQIRLSVWPDGVLWFRACQAAKRGWAFLFAFHGRLDSPGAVHGLVARFEESLLLVGMRKADCEERLLALWRTVNPVVERSSRAQDRSPPDRRTP
jgi:hypothetical protein